MRAIIIGDEDINLTTFNKGVTPLWLCTNVLYSNNYYRIHCMKFNSDLYINEETPQAHELTRLLRKNSGVIDESHIELFAVSVIMERLTAIDYDDLISTIKAQSFNEGVKSVNSTSNSNVDYEGSMLETACILRGSIYHESILSYIQKTYDSNAVIINKNLHGISPRTILFSYGGAEIHITVEGYTSMFHVSYSAVSSKLYTILSKVDSPNKMAITQVKFYGKTDKIKLLAKELVFEFGGWVDDDSSDYRDYYFIGNARLRKGKAVAKDDLSFGKDFMFTKGKEYTYQVIPSDGSILLPTFSFISDNSDKSRRISFREEYHNIHNLFEFLM